MYKAVKRLIDFIASFFGIFVLSPIFLIVSVLVVLKLGKPVFFTQIRPGKNCKPFKMVKFRTMTNEKNSAGKLLSNEKRMTKFGRFLRTSSLDELPELLNVLIGDMSLVGPRPLLMDYLPFFSKEENKRHLVKPGITGWAQVKGRNALIWPEKFKLDVWYVENRNLILDLRILFLTISKVLKREDIAHKGNVAMPRFDEYVKNLNN